jgi:hypothetical protein
MVGGFASNDGSHADLYQRKSQYDLPSVHIIGKSDLIVPSSHSEHLAGFFKAPLCRGIPAGMLFLAIR